MFYLSYIFIFFFKQKTAYEMRISDWSSDGALPIFGDIRQWHQELHKLKETGRCGSPGFFMPYHFVSMALLLKEEDCGELHLPSEVTEYAARLRVWEAIGLPSHVAVSPEPGGSQIGRASCGKRVCQYVYIWVVAVSIKKK